MASSSAAAPRQLGVLDAVATMVGIILGTGIFIAPAEVAKVAPGPLAGAALWLAGGAIALAGAFCYAECASRLPEDGGFFLYYERAFGARLAEISGWVAWLVTYPASLTAVAWIAARYLRGMGVGAERPPALIAGALIVGCAALVALGLRLGAWLQRVLTGTKVVAIALVAIAAIWRGAAHAGGDAGAAAAVAGGPPPLPLSGAACLTAFATLMWTFDGWSDITMLAGQIRRPERNLARAAVWGVMLPATCYALVQLAVCRLLPPGAVQRSPNVLMEALSAMAGGRAGLFLGVLALVSAVGALHGVSTAVSRLGAAMASDGKVPRLFAARHPTLGTPLRALAVPVVMSLVYLVGQNFEQLMGSFAFSVWLYYALTAAAVVRLRARGIGDAAAWRAPGGLLAPALVMAAAAVMTGLQLRQNLRATAIGVGAVALVAIVRELARAASRRPSRSAGPG